MGRGHPWLKAVKAAATVIVVPENNINRLNNGSFLILGTGTVGS